MNLKKYIGDKTFYKTVLMIAIPIMLQNFITNFVSMLDNLMVGYLGTESVSGVSIVNEFIFVFSLTVFGAISGAGIFTSQFYGKADNDGIRYTVRFKVLCAVILTVVGVGVILLFGDKLITLYLHDEYSKGNTQATFEFAKSYLKIIVFGLLPFALTQAFSGTLRETEKTFVPMIAGFVAVFTNCIFNFLLIFGKLGLPALGVRGAAIATVISRYVECLLVIIYMVVKRNKFEYVKGLFKSIYIPKKLLTNIIIKGLPLMGNEFLWSLGMALLSVGYSLYGVDVVAGYSISSTFINLFNIVFLTLGSSIGIIVGKQLGAGDFEKAVDTDRKLIAFSFMVSIAMAVIAISISGLIPHLYKTNEESKRYAVYFMRILGAFLPAVSFANASYFTLRCGGRTIITSIFDSVFGMCVPVPLVFFSYYVLGLPIWATFLIAQSTDILKDIVGFILIKKRIWVQKIVS